MHNWLLKCLLMVHFPASFLNFHHFCFIQLTVNNSSIKADLCCNRTRVLRYLKRPRCQLCHNHGSWSVCQSGSTNLKTISEAMLGHLAVRYRISNLHTGHLRATLPKVGEPFCKISVATILNWIWSWENIFYLTLSCEILCGNGCGTVGRSVASVSVVRSLYLVYSRYIFSLCTVSKKTNMYKKRRGD